MRKGLKTHELHKEQEGKSPSKDVGSNRIL